MQKTLLIFLALFVTLTAGTIILDLLYGRTVEFEKHLAEGFYYAAIGMAVYHIMTRTKERREEEARKREQQAASEMGASSDEEDDSGETDETDDGEASDAVETDEEPSSPNKEA